MKDLGVPLAVLESDQGSVCANSTHLVHYVLERVGTVDCKAYKDDVGFGVGQRAQPVILLLPSRVPQGQLDHLAGGRVWGVGDVILEHGGDVFLAESAREGKGGMEKGGMGGAETDLREVAGAVADQKACLAATAVADDDQLLGIGGRLGDGRVSCGSGGIGADGTVAVALAGGPDGLADGCDGGGGRLCALLATQVVVVLRRGGRGHGGSRWCGR